MSLDLISRNGKFRSLFGVQFLGALNDNFLKNAMVVLVEYQGLSMLGLAPALIVALAGAVFILPFFLFSMLAGQIADQMERSKMVKWVKIWELGITVVASVGFVRHDIYLLLGALFMMGTHSTFFGPIKYGCIPDIVPPHRLVAANAYIETGTFLAILLGTIGGGVLISREFGEIWITVALNTCSVLGLIGAYKLPLLPSHSPRFPIRLSPIDPLRETLGLVRGSPQMLHILIGISWFWFFGAALLSVLPPYCKEFLKVDEHVITAFLAMFTLGIGIGSILCERLSLEKVVLGFLPVGALGMSVFLADLCWVQFQPVHLESGPLMTLGEFWHAPYGKRLLFDFLMLSIFGGFFALPLYTAMQARSDKRVRARIVAGNNVLNALFMVGASLMVMVAHSLNVSITQTLSALAVLNLFALAHMLFWVPECRDLMGWWREWRSSSRI